jgi:hypothetical protein
MNRNLLRAIGVTVAAVLLTGCATMRVSSHSDHGLIWSKYRTFDWGPADALPPGDPRLDRDPYFKDRFEGAIEKALAAHGFDRSATTEQPDLLIHYHAAITDRVNVEQVEQIDRGFGYCTTVDCAGRVTRYEAGTFVVDIVDAATNVLIWRGWAQDDVEGVLGNKDRLRRRIDDSVRRMFASVPDVR